jgi:outer membrane protein TolC
LFFGCKNPDIQVVKAAGNVAFVVCRARPGDFGLTKSGVSMHFFHQFKRIPLCILLVPLGSLFAQTSIDSNDGSISLREAVQRAIVADPRLKLNATLAEAAEGQIEQANTRPNPVFRAEAEDFMGTGPISNVQGLEITVGMSQVIETADKRKKRTSLARAQRTAVDWERESLLAEVQASVHSAFVDVLLAQTLLDLRREQLALAERSAKETARLVESARLPQV